MLKNFFVDFKTALDELFTDFTLMLFYPRQWDIARQIIANSKKS